MQKWEYRHIRVQWLIKGPVVNQIDNRALSGDYPLMTEYLNDLGRGGWEVVGLSETHILLKRPLP